MTALVDRLRAAIEARKALAEPGAGESWEVGREDGDGGWQIPGIVGAGYEGGGVWSREDADHIVANQPSTVLARCKADLRILEWHSYAHECAGPGDNCLWIPDDETCPTVLAIAEGYGITEDA